MCLMQTDLPVPDGPRIIEILPSGMPMLRPRRILLRPNALCTSTNSTASGTPVGRRAPVFLLRGCRGPALLGDLRLRRLLVLHVLRLLERVALRLLLLRELGR